MAVSTYQLPPACTHRAALADEVVLNPGESFTIETGYQAFDSEKFRLDGIEDIFLNGIDLGEGVTGFLHTYPKDLDEGKHKFHHVGVSMFLNQLKDMKKDRANPIPISKLMLMCEWGSFFKGVKGIPRVPLPRRLLAAQLASPLGMKVDDIEYAMNLLHGVKLLDWLFRRIVFIFQKTECVINIVLTLHSLAELSLITPQDLAHFIKMQ